MHFLFTPAIQAGIDSGIYEVVRNHATGQLLGLARDKTTGQFVAHAVSIVTKTGLPIDPLFGSAQLAMGGLQMFQTHRGFQKTYQILDVLQNSVGVLQATTALIGVGTVASLALSSVNLQQTLKLREDVKLLRIELKDGFIDLKKALKNQSAEIIQHIDSVAENVEFRHHRTILIHAYGHFIEAVNWLKNALQLWEVSERNAALLAVEGMLRKALADYNNPELYINTCASGKLRRLECAQAIDQTITLTYQLRGAYDVVSQRLFSSQQKMRQDAIELVNMCQTDEEIDFLFPEILRLYNHDLAVLNSWQNTVDWQRSLSPLELKLFENPDLIQSQAIQSSDEIVNTITASVPLEISAYEDLKQKSHFESLQQQLKFMLKPNLRQDHEYYIMQQATASGYKTLVPSDWQEIPDLTVANLYCYFKDKDIQKVFA